MLLIDKLTKIEHLKSATAISGKKGCFYVQGHFPNQPVMPGVLIVRHLDSCSSINCLWYLKNMKIN